MRSTQPTGPAGGDLSGAYPNPTVSGINGAAVPVSQSALASNSSGQLIAGSGGGGAAALPGVVQGRLTLASGVPVTTTDQTAKSTIYFTPYKGNGITLWNGSAWTQLTFVETSIAVPATTATVFDVYAYDNSGTLVLETDNWTSSNTVPSYNTTLTNGVYTKSGDKTRLYLGTGRTTGVSGQTSDSAGGTTTQVGGQRFLWNYYNRVRRSLAIIDTTSTWGNSTNNFEQAHGVSTNEVEVVIGVSEDIVEANAQIMGQYSATNIVLMAGVGIDSTTVNSAQIFGGSTPSANVRGTGWAFYSGFLAAGYHALKWLTYAGNGGSTLLGSNASIQSGMTATVFA